jgi:NAD(P)-dependent dehydrogenase (short-subunit alcohol dehydrogenase family)
MNLSNDTEKVAFVTGADRGLGFALTTRLLELGWRVVAGQYMPDWPQLEQLRQDFPDSLSTVPLDVADGDSVARAAEATGKVIDRLDLVINNAGVISPTMHRPIEEPQDYAEIHRMYDVNAVGPLRVVDALLPLTQAGGLKRLCFVSSEAGSINRCRRDSWYGYCMSKTALNMAVSMLFNRLRPEGYTFRLYHPGWMRSYMGGSKNTEADLEPEEAAVPAVTYFLRDRADEDRLILRDWQGHEWPW